MVPEGCHLLSADLDGSIIGTPLASRQCVGSIYIYVLSDLYYYGRPM